MFVAIAAVVHVGLEIHTGLDAFAVRRLLIVALGDALARLATDGDGFITGRARFVAVAAVLQIGLKIDCTLADRVSRRRADDLATITGTADGARLALARVVVADIVSYVFVVSHVFIVSHVTVVVSYVTHVTIPGLDLAVKGLAANDHGDEPHDGDEPQ